MNASPVLLTHGVGTRTRAPANPNRRLSTPHGRRLAVVLTMTGTVCLAGCAQGAGIAATPPRVAPPAPDVVVDYQLGGAYSPPDGVGGVARDASEWPAPGLYSICYVNGFQTQPGETARWIEDFPALVLRDEAGQPLADPAWPDEVLLDASTDSGREAIAALVGASIDTCASRGFDAVEIDNLDSYARSNGQLTADDALALAALYADRAHGLGLAIAQKNAGDVAVRGRDEVGFDFAVVEECHRWDECEAYTDVYDVVIDIEYQDDLRGSFADVCADPATPSSTVLRDRNLSTSDESAYVFDRCRG